MSLMNAAWSASLTFDVGSPYSVHQIFLALSPLAHSHQLIDW
jgi:hypothetical protein